MGATRIRSDDSEEYFPITACLRRGHLGVGQVSLGAWWRTGSGGTINDVYANPGVSEVASGWTKVSFSEVAPAGAGMVKMFVTGNAPSAQTHYVDDYTLTSSPTPALVPISNRTFEAGTENMVNNAGATVAVSTAQAHGGVQSLSITKTGSWSVHDSGVGFAVNSGSLYSIDGFARTTATGTDNVQVGIEWVDSTGALIRTDGIGNNYSVSTGWTAFGTHQAPPPSNAVTARLRLYGGGTASTIYVDDITIAAVPVANQGDIWSYPNVHGDVAITANSQAGETTPVTVIYDPFGQTVNVPDNSAGNFDYGWLGQQQRLIEHQGTLATIEMGARPYLPATGRFLATDPIEGGTPNDYTYVTDPINQNDTTGQSCFAMDANGFFTLRGKGALHGDQDNWCTGAFKKFINSYTGRGNGGGGGDILGMVGHAAAGLGKAIYRHRSRILQGFSVGAAVVAILAVPLTGGTSLAAAGELFAAGATVASVGASVAAQAVDPKPCRAQRVMIAGTWGLLSAGVGSLFSEGGSQIGAVATGVGSTAFDPTGGHC